MQNGVAVLGIDALDHRLVNHWGCENLKLERTSSIETFSYATDHPKTSEVWPTIATGVHPREHGLNKENNAQWNHPALQAASQLTHFLPSSVRLRLSEYFESAQSHTMELPKTDHSHVFEIGRAYEWPGVTEAPHFLQATNYESSEYTEQDLREDLFGHTGKEIGWLVETIRAGCPVAGVQCHILDRAGHIYSNRETRLEYYYRYMDDLVGSVRQRIDRMLVLSDHGMQTSILNDPDPGVHSWDAHCAVQGLDGKLPKDMFHVREFIESNLIEKQNDSDQVVIDSPEEHLRELGYLT